MHNRAFAIIFRSLLIAGIGVFVIDYFSHLLFSNPMETLSYFLGKEIREFDEVRGKTAPKPE